MNALTSSALNRSTTRKKLQSGGEEKIEKKYVRQEEQSSTVTRNTTHFMLLVHMELDTMSNAECITNACRYANSSADALPPGFPLLLLVLRPVIVFL